jgi:outer membrane protein assembly factor BamB
MFHADLGHSGHSGDTSISEGQARSMLPHWTGLTTGYIRSSPAVAKGVIYVGSADGKLYAFDGSTNCSGVPKKCSEVWAGDTSSSFYIESSPAVANGVVYVASGGNGKLFAFDAAGPSSGHCSGGLCEPLWSVPLGGGIVSSAAVYNGVVYIGAVGGRLYALDASGCGNSTCSPLWEGDAGTTAVQSSPAVSDANHLVYVATSGKLYAFPTAVGATSCVGSPRVCAPLWTASLAGDVPGERYISPSVVNGVVYVSDATGTLSAFDAAGKTNCSGAPTSCAPLWTASLGANQSPGYMSTPAVYNGTVYVGTGNGKVQAFDATGNANCSGIPKTCAPIWSSSATGSRIESSPAVVNGVLFVGADNGLLYVFDAAGIDNCSGTPKTCSALWSATTNGAVGSSPAVANGLVYVGSDDDKLYAFGP